MDNYGLDSSNATNYSTILLPLKEKFLELLETKDVSLEVLSKLLDPTINPSQYKTIHERMRNHEEQHGSISLEKWKSIFENLGYLIDFRGIIEQFNRQHGFPCLVEPLSEANGDQKAEGTGTPGHGVDSNKEPNNEAFHPDLQLVAMSAEFSNQLPVINGLDNDCHDNLTMTVKVIAGPMEPPKCCTSWQSLPPPSRPPPPEQKQCKDMNSASGDNYGSTTVTGAEADDSGLFSVQNRESNMFSNDQSSPSHSYISDTNVLSSSALSSLISETDQQNGMSDDQPSSLSNSLDSVTDQHLYATASANLGTDISSQGSDTPARPAATTETETGRSLLGASSLVTGHLPACHSSIAGLHSDDNLNGNQLQTTGNPAENYDDTESFCLLEELQKENEELRSTISFLAQELHAKTLLCVDLRDQNCHLQQELLECRAQCAEQQEQTEELTRHLNDSAMLEAESQHLIRMIQELHDSKQEECNRLEEHIRQAHERYDNSISNMEALSRERQEVSELLMSLRTQLEEVQRDCENFRVQERERLKMENERLLEVRMEEIHLAFCNAETDKVKALKLKLKREKCKRKRMEDRNKDTLKENNQMRSEEMSDVPSAGICGDDVDWENRGPREDECSSASSSEVGADNPARSSSSCQQSASDESSDDELFEDALEHI